VNHYTISHSPYTQKKSNFNIKPPLNKKPNKAPTNINPALISREGFVTLPFPRIQSTLESTLFVEREYLPDNNKD
jgi:hypothetical protein